MCYTILKKAVRGNWHDGYEEHIELQMQLITCIANWQSQIFQVALKPGVRLGEAYKALLIVEEWMQRERSNEFNVRVEWREGDIEWSIDDENGDKIYKGMPEQMLDKMWRDLAMKTIATGDKATAVAVVTHCYDAKNQKFGDGPVENIFAVKGARLVEFRARNEKNRKLVDEIFAQPGVERKIEDDDCSENCSWDGYRIQDEWYADDAEMQAARSELKKMLNYKYE
jgi:hypothetical protein